MCKKAGSCIVSDLMSEYTDDERIYNFYIRITQTMQNPINIKFKKNLTSLLSSQAEENTSYNS